MKLVMLRPSINGAGASLMRAIFLEVLAAALLVTNADAQSDTTNGSANFMVPRCQTFLAAVSGVRLSGVGVAVEAGYCGGAVYGLMFATCHPSDVTVAQAIHVTLAYIQRRPQRMHEDFRTLTIEAMHEAWPCR
jgi:hypothetical protein